jgi:sugar lactone lactonase YvrE
LITTIVGTGIAGFNGDGIRAVTAQLDFPTGIALDAAGNLYIACQGQHRIRRVNSKGIITTVAGNGTAGYSGDGGPATAASLNYPWGVALDSQGNLYFSDGFDSVVRKVDATTGIITTVAGQGVRTGSIDGEGNDPADDLGDGGPATSATLNQPRGVLPDNAGNLYIADTGNHRVRKVDLNAGTITTYAGNGLPGFSDDGSFATETRMGNPRALAFDGAGNLLISNAGRHRVRKVDLNTRLVSTVAGSSQGFDGGGHQALESSFSMPTGLSYDASGNLIIVDLGNQRVRKINQASQLVTTLAGGYLGDGKKATVASLNEPSNLAVDAAGNLYIADTYNHRIRKVDSSGKISTIAGTGISGNNGDGTATSAMVNYPWGVAVNPAGEVFIADTYNGALRRVDSSGNITTLFQDWESSLVSVALDSDGNLYAADDYACVIRKFVPPDYGSRTVAGVDFNCGYNGDGIPATTAYLNGPYGLAVDGTGTLYIGDTYNNRVRKVDSNGIITTIAGDGTCAFRGDGGPATEAALCTPRGVALDSSGNVLIADTNNLRLRKVGTDGKITTIAGSGQPHGYNGDKIPATSANLGNPVAVAVDAQGIVYMADAQTMLVRKISAGRTK